MIYHSSIHSSLKNWLRDWAEHNGNWFGEQKIEELTEQYGHYTDTRYLMETAMRRIRELVEEGYLEQRTQKGKTRKVNLAYYRSI